MSAVTPELLDETLEKVVSLMSDVIKLKYDIEENMREGYLKMSEARYTMGVNSVSILQVDLKNMQAQKKVIENCKNDDQFPVFDVVDQNERNSDSLYNKNIRSRFDANKKFAEKNLDNEKKETKESNVESLRNPLHWFGFLTPAALKKCQQNFSDVSKLSCQMANLQSELDFYVKKYDKLKSEFEASSPGLENLNDEKVKEEEL